MPSQGFADRAVGVGLVAGVGHQKHGAGLLGERIAEASATPGEPDLGTLGAEPLDDLAADVAGAPGDDRDLALQPHRCHRW